MKEDRDGIEYLEQLDRFLDGEEDGTVPLDLLRSRGVTLRPPGEVAPDEVRAELWKAIEAMASIGAFIDSTDHLSDAELYEFVWHELHVPTFLLPDDPCSAWHISPFGCGSEADNEIYLRYYADEETRRHRATEFGDPLPPAQRPPYDRDRLLPTQEMRLAEFEEPQ
ncbi:MAG: hypothetical protein WA208_18705 [Thermoanaerobaculia bacterium]